MACKCVLCNNLQFLVVLEEAAGYESNVVVVGRLVEAECQIAGAECKRLAPVGPNELVQARA